MNTQEAFQLLTLASARDGRTVDIAVAAVWADDLADIPLQDAVSAARAHYRASEAWLMPAHVIRGVQETRRRALPATMSPEAPEDCGNHKWLADGTCLYCTTRRDH
jgi:hypothetical protein